MYYRRLKDLREDHDLTQTQLVELLGMHKTTYTNYEQGKREIPFSLVIRLARLYDVSIDFIAEFTDEPLPLPSSGRGGRRCGNVSSSYARKPEGLRGEDARDKGKQSERRRGDGEKP